MDYIRIDLPVKKDREVLALGSQSRPSFCFVKNGAAYLAGAEGDLSLLENLEIFEGRIRRLQKKLKARPRIIACDSHPEYTSTKLAGDIIKGQGLYGLRPSKGSGKTQSGRLKETSLRLIQHHEAHVASCITDNMIKGSVIGVAFDGTGYGLDGNIWGGEFFTGSIRGFRRAAHLKYIPMPGGEASIREPWRMALSYLYNIYGRGLGRQKIGLLNRLDKYRTGLIIQIIDKNINSPLTSSMGRLFDAVSAILGICEVARYEAQGAIELEKSLGESDEYAAEGYRFNITSNKGIFMVSPDEVIRDIVKDLRRKAPVGLISLRFHNAICHMIKDVSNLLRKRTKLSRVCLSGGVFQNRYLREHVKTLLERDNFHVYLHKRIPAHDGNIALGQAVLAV